VRDLIYEDVYEKKVRIAMAQEFARLQETARIDNFVAGTVQSPSKGKSIDQIAPNASRGDAVQTSFEAPPGVTR